MMRAAIYLRVSTDRQTTANQRAPLLALCAARGWADPLVVEEVESGAKRRPALDALCERAARGEIGAIVCWAIDRLGRTRCESAERLRQLAHVGCRAVSYRESWLDQPAGPMRDLLIQIVAWVAEEERARLIDRTRAGLDRARAQGKTLGRPRTVDPVVLATAVAAVAAGGRSVRSVAKAYGIGEGTLRRALPGFGGHRME